MLNCASFYEGCAYMLDLLCGVLLQLNIVFSYGCCRKVYAACSCNFFFLSCVSVYNKACWHAVCLSIAAACVVRG